MDIGSRIDILRKKSHMKKKDLAQTAGISATYLSLIINGSKNPTIETLTLICNALGITIGEFFDDNNSLPIPPHLKEFIDSARLLTPEQVKALNEFLKTLE